ncbi:hypothetical protein ACFV7R_39155 [Streptomyces sp. NPDC059866]|uniref:hypothetical protein n=1 Tax=Streptomyces sp. NPDC059866 TaxID=3346978 RepID=UPI0036494430
MAVDMPGHGLKARRLAASTRRPHVPSDFSSEKSPVADVDLDRAATVLAEQARRAVANQSPRSLTAWAALR